MRCSCVPLALPWRFDRGRGEGVGNGDTLAAGSRRAANRTMLGRMFVVTETDAAAIRAAFHQGGELAAAVELRRLFPGVADTAQARAYARSIAGWKPLALPLRPATRRRRLSRGE